MKKRKTILGTKQTLCMARGQAQNWNSSVHLFVRGEQGQQCEIAASRTLSGPTMALGRLVHWPISPLGLTEQDARQSTNDLGQKPDCVIRRGQAKVANARIRQSDGEHWLMLQCFIQAREINGTWLESSGTSGAGANVGLAGRSSIRGLAPLR